MKLPFILAAVLLPILVSCSSSWLEIKPDQALVVPHSTKDFQAWLDNVSKFNRSNSFGYMEIASDNLYLTDEMYNGISSSAERNIYSWAKGPADFYGSAGGSSWRDAYAKLLEINAVLEGIEKIDRSSNMQAWDNVKGSALFYRAFYHYVLVSEFCQAYSADDPLGIPLRTSSNPNVTLQRSSLSESYGQIILDLKEAAVLLPLVSENKMRPSRAAAWGMLSRVYLAMSDYSNALRYAQECLSNRNTLLDYNTLDQGAAYPFTWTNEEVIFSVYLINPSILWQSDHVIDSTLYQSYTDYDLRKTLFFRINSGLPRFKGGYFGSVSCFVGLATDEIYLTAMECMVRLGRVEDAEFLFNKLLSTRYRTDRYVPVNFTDAEKALLLILQERRKSLLFRCLRLSDIKRLNKTTEQQVWITRTLNGQETIIPPNDPRYAFPIPQKELLLNALPQNPR
ncbi:RagB/SusD family nutrient uptake outer membrane protein [Sphingobacterium thalpophilum]|uniref:RagB/SusD family nutrient uptake outer membrane protein n=1 Tax=Sphingobacterium thalpophilum TaxID=259 RepID=A0ABV4HFH2_9SPHI